MNWQRHLSPLKPWTKEGTTASDSRLLSLMAQQRAHGGSPVLECANWSGREVICWKLAPTAVKQVNSVNQRRMLSYLRRGMGRGGGGGGGRPLPLILSRYFRTAWFLMNYLQITPQSKQSAPDLITYNSSCWGSQWTHENTNV